MLKKEQNERITRVGPGTAMGNVFRHYWMPFAIEEELPEPDCPPLRVRLLGEDLIAFRDSNGEVGLIDAYCPHRMAPMFFGRNEKCGLRCVYHGWKFDNEGNCVDMPNEPPESNFKNKMKIKSYPVWESGGVIWTFMGSKKDIPPKPEYEWLRAPKTHRFVSKTYEHCNYLQAMEGGLDTSHSSFLHNNDIEDKTNLRSQYPSPKLEVEKTDYGYMYAGIRDMDEKGKYVRAYQFVMPFQQFRGSVLEWSGKRKKVPTVNGHMWVPVDDHHCYVYNWMYSYDESIPLTPEYCEKAEARMGRAKSDFLTGYPAYRLKANGSNDYFIDREEQRTKTYSGIKGINTQDMALQEQMGPIVDRTKEHLGTTDLAIIAARQLLLEAADTVENKKDNPLKGLDPATHRHIRATESIIEGNEKWQESLGKGLQTVY